MRFYQLLNILAVTVSILATSQKLFALGQILECRDVFSAHGRMEEAASVSDNRRLIAEYAVLHKLPAYSKPTQHGLLPVILINKKNVDGALTLMMGTMGQQFVHQTADPTDHGMLRIREINIDLDTPGQRTFGEINGNGISWKGTAPYLKHRSNYDAYNLFEVVYKPSEYDLDDVMYYQKMRRASIIVAPYTMGGGARPAGDNLVNYGEQCFTFSTGAAARQHAEAIRRQLSTFGVRESDEFLKVPVVAHFIVEARNRLLNAKNDDSLVLNSKLLMTLDSAKLFQLPELTGLPEEKKPTFLNWLVGYDASNRYALVLQRLAVSLNASGPTDVNNPNAVAIFVYDEDTTPENFLSPNYRSAGRFSEWSTLDRQPIDKITAH